MRAYLERALALRERVLGPEHPQTAGSLNNLAGLHYAQGNYGAALPLFERALSIHEQALGADHPATATSVGNLAVFYAYRGDFATAIPLIERALAIRLRTLGPGHPGTVSTEESLATMRRAAGQQSSTPRNPTEALAPLLATIAAIAVGNEAQRPAVEQALAQLEQQGWMLRGPVAQIWQGEREREALVEGLDAQHTLLVERILELTHEYAAAAASIAELRGRAAHAVAQALAGDDVEQRAAVIAKLEILAQSSEREPIDPLWQKLAAYLRELAAQLKQP